MKILLISHSCQSETEGLARARAVAALPNVELLVVVPERWKHYGEWRTPSNPNPGARFRWSPQRIRFPWLGPAQSYLHFYPRLREVIKDFDPDIIDVWEEPWSLVAAQAARLRAKCAPRAKLVIETEQNINKRLPPPFERFRSLSIATSDAMIARSSGAAQVLRDKGYAGRIEIIPNGLDHELFKPLDRAEARKRFELDPSRFYIGYAGRVVVEKGLDDLVHAISKSGAHLLIAGSGPYRGELEKKISSIEGLAARVRWMGDLAPDSLAVFMNAINALALPSRTTGRWKEQYGRVITEAQACETPVVGSNSGAIPEVVGQGGEIFCEGDALGLSEIISRWSSDAAALESLGRQGRAQVLAQSTWARVAERLLKLFVELRS